MADRVYTEKDLKGFSEKDLRIVRQNALSHATEVVKHCLNGDMDTLANAVMILADKFTDFVYTGMEFPLQKEKYPSEVSQNVGSCLTSTDRIMTQARTPDPEDDTGIPTTTTVEKPTTKFPTPTREQTNVLLAIASELAVDIGPGNEVDFEEFVARVYKAFGKYPSTKKSLTRIRTKVEFPIIKKG
jgi:hypothetical protein